MEQTRLQETPYSLTRLYELPVGSVRSHSLFRNWIASTTNTEHLLASIPVAGSPSYRPLHLLYLLLTEVQAEWSALILIKHHARISNYLPDVVTDGGSQSPLHWLVDTTQQLVKNSYPSLNSFLRDDSKPALHVAEPGNPITHGQLKRFVDNFSLPISSATNHQRRKPIVAIALQNGPLLAALNLAVATYYIAAPINPAVGPTQFRADVVQAGATCILTTQEEYQRLCLSDPWTSNGGITIFFVERSSESLIAIHDCCGNPLAAVEPDLPNGPDDISLVLFTSGTSGTKKVVPLTRHCIVAGIAFVIDSWGLGPEDTCLNMMPLHHVGGLVRNIFAPLFSGGSTICCAAFDPVLFWDVLESMAPTWYYASPSMHSVILAERRDEALRDSKIRLVCNAAGGLLPSLASQLRDTFSCTVLPSYGMTECMPISTPPLSYTLDRPGTSGVCTGPELSVLNWSDTAAELGVVGRVCVRNGPVFPGYLRPDGSFDKTSFTDQGWFDTGDLGYMDSEGYLYITGRSKEVINRGGELISPFEVENAIMAASSSSDTCVSGKISQVLAFSVQHDILQEVVAVAVVTATNAPRPDLKAIHSALRCSLQQAKWPCLVVYMNDIPKRNNKLLRIKLGARLGLPEMTNNTPTLERHWEAVCPPPDTSLSVEITASPVAVGFDKISNSLCSLLPAEHHFHLTNWSGNSVPDAILAPRLSDIKPLGPAWVNYVKETMSQQIHGYLIPTHVILLPQPLPLDPHGSVDESLLRTELEKLQTDITTSASIDGRVRAVFASVLSIEIADVDPSLDFFHLGGDSLQAGKLLSSIRAEFGVQLPIGLIFNHGTAKAISTKVSETLELLESQAPETGQTNVAPQYPDTRSSTNPVLMALQLLPMTILYPMRRGFQWTLFILVMSWLQALPTNMSVPGRLFNLVLSITASRIASRIFAPLVGIAAKWIIIGRYRKGLYPMWGSYHTRWWVVQKIIAICGKGFFGATSVTNNMYYRLMGAKIGRGVKLGGASLGEYDLLDIGDNVVFSRCTVRPFAAEGTTTMYLDQIVVGDNCSVGLSSVIAPGAVVPANTCLGPNSSSWEIQDADEKFRDSLASKAPKPHWLMTLCFTYPILFVAWFLTLTPWLAGLTGMVISQALGSKISLREILAWFAHPTRVGYHYLALVLRTLVSPFILFGFTILVKNLLDLLFGKLQPSPSEGRGNIDTWRTALIKALLPVDRLHDMTSMFGQHYEATSTAIRLLGGRIGKRVYWPGTGPSIGDYHLLDIGDDVVFGSRAHLVTSDGTGSETIKIGDNAMIADRVTLLPGAEIGERATMGSGALVSRNRRYAPDSTYVGSKGGEAVCLHAGSDEAAKEKREALQFRRASSGDTFTRPSGLEKGGGLGSPQAPKVGSVSSVGSNHRDTSSATLSPFGRAFHLGLAPFHVLGPFAIFSYSSFIIVFTAFYWNVPSISSIQVANRIFEHHLQSLSGAREVLVLYGIMTLAIAVLTTAEAVLSLGAVIGSKWLLLGRRQPGNYDWDRSPYCQRWQLFLTIEKIRRHCYRGEGVLNLLTGTAWLSMYFRLLGAQIGKDCCLFANGRPSLMFTEPDLITLGDRVTIDDASVVAHINTRGKFDLNRLEIGDRSVLRTGSRLLSGATMKKDSCLLEHTLVMGGDVVEEGWTMQGWPAERYMGDRVMTPCKMRRLDQSGASRRSSGTTLAD